MAMQLKDVPVGSVVKIKESNTLQEFIVLDQDGPTNFGEYQNIEGTWLMRKNSRYSMTWGISHVDYSSSGIHKQLNSEYYNSIDPEIRTRIKKVSIPYAYWDPSAEEYKASTLSCNVFIFTPHEAGRTSYSGTSGEYVPTTGNELEYFQDNADRKDKVVDAWTRSQKVQQQGTQACYLTRMYVALDPVRGQNGVSYADVSGSYHKVFPIFVLPHDSTLKVDDNMNVVINSTPTVPSTITVPNTIRGGSDVTVSWTASTDPDDDLDGYIVERSYNGGSSWAQIYQGRTTSTTTMIPLGTETVMFRVCSYDTHGEKSGWRTSANKTVVNNRAPAAPPSISVPLKPAGGEKLTVTWTASTDQDGNLEGYELERQWDGAGAFTQIYKGAALSFQDDIPKGAHSSVIYRVRAYDSFDAYSSYTTSPSRTIDNNTAPVIACDLSGDLGEKSEGFTIPYTVSDAEQQEVTVAEKVGDLVKRTYKTTLDEQATFEVTGEYFQKILNGAQTVQIVATDSAGKSSTLSLTFTKAVHKAVITLSEPLAVEEQITVAVLAVTGDIPADAAYQVEMTNNGNDPEPVWEDATADVKAGRNYVFQNKTQTNGWAFNFRVTAERGESDEDGYIVSIQGGFQ